MFFKISVIKSFANFTGKHLCWSFLLTKFLTNFIKKTLQHRRFAVKLAKFLRTPFFYRTTPVAASACNIVAISLFIFKLIHFII